MSILTDIKADVETALLCSEEFARLKQEWGGMSGAINEMRFRRMRIVGGWLATVQKTPRKMSAEQFIASAPPEILQARLELLALGD